MTDIIDEQSGELKNQVRKDIKHRELMEINSIPAQFADRLYITPKGQTIILSFCEDVPSADDTKVRSRVAMHVPAFLHFTDMLNTVANQIREAMEQQQQPKTKEEHKGLH